MSFGAHPGTTKGANPFPCNVTLRMRKVAFKLHCIFLFAQENSAGGVKMVGNKRKAGTGAAVNWEKFFFPDITPTRTNRVFRRLLTRRDWQFLKGCKIKATHR